MPEGFWDVTGTTESTDWYHFGAARPYSSATRTNPTVTRAIRRCAARVRRKERSTGFEAGAGHLRRVSQMVTPLSDQPRSRPG